MTQPLILGYWGFRGRAQVSRLVCAYTGVAWEEKIYTSPEEWFGSDKQQLGILFPNLPYIIDGDVKISESDILPRYIIKKSGQTDLLGKNPQDMALVDNVIYAVYDMFTPFVELFFNKKWEDDKTSVFYKQKSKLAKLDKFIGAKDTTMGYLTLADFVISEFSYYIEKLFPEQYEKFKAIQRIRNTIQSLQAVKKYYEQTNSVQAVFLPPTSTVLPFYLDKFDPKQPLPPKLIQKMSSSPKKKASQVQKQLILNKGQKLKVILISGSLRKHSTNSGLLRACVELNNPNLTFQWADILDVPMFNEDVEKQGVPASVQRIKEQIKNSHAILFGVSENNQCVSACLKNIYDWLSRGNNSVVKGTPAAMVSSGGMTGGLTAQTAFRQVGRYCGVKFMQKPQICVKRFQTKSFDQEGNLTNEKIRQDLKVFLSAFAKWIDSNKANQ